MQVSFRLPGPGRSGITFGRQSGEVGFLGRAEEWRREWILRAKVIPEWDQHRNASITPVRAREDAQFVAGGCNVGDHLEQPVKVIFVNAMSKESDDSKKV